jgi:NitT/TauT family transport system substrate-binding protein
MTRAFCAILVAGLALCGGALCGAVRAEDAVWHHGIVEAKSDAGIVFMPAQHDFAARQGLKIDYVQLKGDALVLKAFLAGDLDSYEGSPGGAIIAAAHGADVKLVGCYWPGLTYGLFTKGGIDSVAGLAGKNIAISSPGSLPDLMVRAVLEKNGMAAGLVHFAMLGADADRFRALSAGTVDAAAFSTEFLPMIQGQGISLLVNAAAALPDYLRFCTYMSSRTLKERPAQAAAFLAAGMQGYRHAMADRGETLALTRSIIHVGADDPRPGQLFDEAVNYHAVDPTMALPMDKLAWMQALLVRTGNLPAPYDLTRLVDPAPRQAALGLAGK